MKTVHALAVAGWMMVSNGAYPQTNSPPLVELHVKNVVYVRAMESPVVILEDKEEKRFLPIWIGPGEAQAIALEMYHVHPPRPMTHDLFASLVKELDATVDKIVITETRKNTYFAQLYVSSSGRSRNIDCRPSDGIAIALRTKAPILVADAVMANALSVPANEGEAQSVAALGLTVQTLTPDLAEAFGLGKTRGVLVSGSDRKEIQRGDVILAVGSNPVESVGQLSGVIEKAGSRKDVTLKLLREGKTMTVTVAVSPPKR